MTTAASLLLRAATRFRDTGADIISSQQWLDYLNEAYKKANTKTPLWPWLESNEQTISVSASTRATALPADSLQVNWVYDITHDRKLVPDEGRGSQWAPDQLRSDVGTVRTYKVRNNCIEVFPLASEATSLRVEVVTWPGALACADEPAFPESFHELLLDGMLARAYADDGNLEWAQYHGGIFDQAVEDMKNALLVFRTESYSPIRDNFFG